MKYLFDVGAHLGEDSLHFVRNDPNLICYAFEPTAELAQYLRDASRDFADRYRVVECAVADFDGTADFHLVHNDTGSSSLNEFQDADTLSQTWRGRTDFTVRGTITVPVVRLDTWLKANAPDVQEIEHLHIDAQGSDLAVLKGLGDMITIVKSGVVEVPQSQEVKLYKTQHSKEETLDFLASKGLIVREIRPQQNEDNIFFGKE